MAVAQAGVGRNNAGVRYNVSLAVGRGSANRRDDVLLVQYLLQTIYDMPNPNTGNLLQRPREDEIVVDGIFGPITGAYILAIQQAHRKNGGAIITDGRVDSAVGETVSGGFDWTIDVLNADYELRRPDDFADLASAGDIPPELVGPLAQNG